ncbi:MAG: hypothetical protein HUU54_07890 [Ignavibacteriaceae bacterium]|nr:hypothetical protein [Ignavibacteriaceae bacterium]
MFEGYQRVSRFDGFKRWIPSLILIPVCFFFLSYYPEYTYVDYFHYVVHVAGETIFGLLGDTAALFGGTVTQLMIPVLLIIFFYVNYLRKWLQFALFLMGHTFLNIGAYASDAAAMKIELFGPPEVNHDWNKLLTQYDMMSYMGDISMFFFVMAVIAFLAAILTPRLVAH